MEQPLEEYELRYFQRNIAFYTSTDAALWVQVMVIDPRRVSE
jgi:hypothetical protein